MSIAGGAYCVSPASFRYHYTKIWQRHKERRSLLRRSWTIPRRHPAFYGIGSGAARATSRASTRLSPSPHDTSPGRTSAMSPSRSRCDRRRFPNPVWRETTRNRATHDRRSGALGLTEPLSLRRLPRDANAVVVSEFATEPTGDAESGQADHAENDAHHVHPVMIRAGPHEIIDSEQNHHTQVERHMDGGSHLRRRTARGRRWPQR